MNMEHDDVFCKLFSYTFVGKASMWFFSLAARSITSWKQLETTFMTQFRDEKTYGILFLDISQIKINKKEKIKDSNEIFIDILTQILDKPTESIQIELYIYALPPLVVIFVKGKEKKTLA